MNEIFKNINEEKRDRIINSALEEFSKNGFDKASTNIIVKNAGISKGSLFHYFKNKQELFEKLEEYMIETATHAVKNDINWEETDFFERMKQIVISKGEVMYQYPYIYDFISMVMEPKSMEEIRKKTEKVSSDLLSKVYTYNIDFSKFKEGLDMEKTMNIIRWTLEKFSEELWQEVKSKKRTIDFSEILRELEKYSTFLKNMFYKKQN